MTVTDDFADALGRIEKPLFGLVGILVLMNGPGR